MQGLGAIIICVAVILFFTEPDFYVDIENYFHENILEDGKTKPDKHRPNTYNSDEEITKTNTATAVMQTFPTTASLETARSFGLHLFFRTSQIMPGMPTSNTQVSTDIPSKKEQPSA